MEDFVRKFIDIVSHDTIHDKDIDKSFHDTIIRNYQTILSKQQALCGVDKYQFKLRDMKPVYRVDRTKAPVTYKNFTQFGYTIGDSLISYKNRYLLYSANISNTLISQSDIGSPKYSNLFDRNFLFFINGYYIDGVNVIVDDNDTMFVLTISDESGFNGEKFTSLRNNDATVTDSHLIPTNVY